MKPDISEFSYGYALTSEIVQSCGATMLGAPIFPSLIEEGSLGYDLSLPIAGNPLFLQFKLSDWMVLDSAKGADKVAVPHYRMHLRPLKHSKQHDLLLRLESRGKCVFYAAPEFSRAEELNDVYQKKNVIQRTAFFRPSAIGHLPTKDDHFVCFGVGSSYGYLFSEPVRVARESSERIPELMSARPDDASARRESANEFLRQLGDEIVNVWLEGAEPLVSRDEYLHSLHAIRNTRGPLEYAGYVSQTLVDSTLLVRLARRVQSPDALAGIK